MFYKTLLVGVLLGALLMSLSYISSYASLRKPKSPSNELQLVDAQNKPVNGFFISALAFIKFLSTMLIISAILLTTFFIVKFVGLI
jgi:hypothetical protein